MIELKTVNMAGKVDLRVFVATVFTIVIMALASIAYVRTQYVGNMIDAYLTLPDNEASYIIGQYNSTHYYAKNSVGFGYANLAGYEMLSSNASAVISNAAGNSTNGDKIYIRPGTYLIDNIKITKPISLLGAGVIKGFADENGTCFVPSGNTVSMIQFLWDGSTMLYGGSVQGINFHKTSGSYDVVGIELNGTNQFKISDCSFKNLTYGAVKVDRSCFSGEILNSVFWYCGSTNHPALNFNSSTSGYDRNMGWKVAHCTFEYNVGISAYLRNTLQTEFSSNVFEGDRYATNFIYCDTGTDETDIHDNPWFWNCNGTVDVQVFANSYVHDNYFRDGLGTNQEAINVTANNNVIHHNVIYNYSSYGIEIAFANNTIDHNILDVTKGIYLVSGVALNTVVTANSYGSGSGRLVDDGTNTVVDGKINRAKAGSIFTTYWNVTPSSPNNAIDGNWTSYTGYGQAIVNSSNQWAGLWQIDLTAIYPVDVKGYFALYNNDSSKDFFLTAWQGPDDSHLYSIGTWAQLSVAGGSTSETSTSFSFFAYCRVIRIVVSSDQAPVAITFRLGDVQAWQTVP